MAEVPWPFPIAFHRLLLEANSLMSSGGSLRFFFVAEVMGCFVVFSTFCVSLSTPFLGGLTFVLIFNRFFVCFLFVSAI